MIDDINKINNYMKNVYNTFGGQSKEYMNTLDKVKEILPDNVVNETTRSGNIYKGDNPKSPLQFKNTKASREIFSHFETEISQINQQIDKNDVQKMKEKYVDQLKYYGKEVTSRGVKRWAKWEYDFSNNGDEWYKTLTESDALTNSEKEEARDLYRDVSGNYDNPDFKLKFSGKIRKMINKVNRYNKDEPEPITEGTAANPLDLINPLE